MEAINIFCIVGLIILWILLGWAGWALTIDNTKNKKWLKNINEDARFKMESKFFHLLFGPLSFINGIIHTF